MKFVHIADLHFDIPFTSLNRIQNLSNIRRLEQREALRKVIEYIKENSIECLFISGDLYEHEYIKQSTIEYINNLFKQIPDTRIFISPGNHDPYITNSYYSKYSWNENVYIFNQKINKVSYNDCDIYGYGFQDFYCKDSKIENIEIENPEKINILIAHGSLNDIKKSEEDYFNYNPINKNNLKNKNFDYVALGHIHKTNFDENENIIYPGSLISFGFDELGKHGMIVGEITKNNRKIKFVNIDNREFKEEKLDISKIISKEELVEKINNLKIEPNKLYKIILIGSRNFEVDINLINKLIENNQILKIKDNTEIGYDLEKMSRENDLKGIFVKLMLEKQANSISEENREKIERAIEYGIDALSEDR